MKPMSLAKMLEFQESSMFKELFQKEGVSMERLQEMGAERVDAGCPGWPPMKGANIDFDEAEILRKTRLAQKISKRKSKKAAEDNLIKGSKDDDYDLEKHLEKVEGTGKKAVMVKAMKQKNTTKKTNNTPKDSITHDGLPKVLQENKKCLGEKKNKDMIEMIKTEDLKNKELGQLKQITKSYQNLCRESKSQNEEEILKNLIADKQAKIKEQKDHSETVMESKDKEMDKLVAGVEATKEKKSKIMTKVATIDAKMNEMQKSKDQMIHMCVEQEDIKNKLLKKKEKLEKFITTSLNNAKHDITKTEKEVEELQAKLKNITKPPTTKLNIEPKSEGEDFRLRMVDYINQKIATKEVELECPVCLETASAPIFMCEEQHLVCGGCRKWVITCPECRSIYSRPRRHRYAERASEELEALRREREELLEQREELVEQREELVEGTAGL